MVNKLKAASVTLSGSSSGNLNFSIPANQTWLVHRLKWNSTGAFDFDNIRVTGTGESFLDNSVPDTAVEDTNGDNVLTFDEPIELSGAATLVVDMTDTSASSNTVDATLLVEQSS